MLICNAVQSNAKLHVTDANNVLTRNSLLTESSHEIEFDSQRVMRLELQLLVVSLRKRDESSRTTSNDESVQALRKTIVM